MKIFMDFLQKLMSIFNIKADENQKFLLLSMFFSGLLSTYICPTITKTLISELPAQWIAIQSLVMSISILIVDMMWKGKLRDTVIKYFLLLAISESVIGFLLGMYLCFINYNSWVFAICSLFYSSFIINLVGKCIMAFKSKLWNESGRELYDNNLDIVGGIISILGFGFSLILLPTLKVSLFMWGMCCIIDDIGWIIVYFKNKDKLCL